LGVDHAKNDTERFAVTVKAGAHASLLFDVPLAPEHKKLDVEAERKAAYAWLTRQPVFKELVVQTLRVQNTLAYEEVKGSGLYFIADRA
jgi:hypothetical protein